MRVLNISSTDLASRAFNGFDYHSILSLRGIRSELAVTTRRQSNEAWVFDVFPGPYEKLRGLAARIEEADGKLNALQTWTPSIISHPRFRSADLIHLQVVTDRTMSRKALGKIFRYKPTLWTWHDLSPITGHCIFPGDCNRWEKGCGNCPDLLRPFSVRRDKTAENRQANFELLSDAAVSIHLSTDWMKRKVDKLAGHLGLRTFVFQFGIDLDLFNPSRRIQARKALGIPQNQFVLIARATSDKRKGFQRLLVALKKMKMREPITLITFQEKGLVENHEYLNVHESGWVYDRAELSSLYSAADLAVMPSTDESFGFFALEAMASGTPVLCFADTAVQEVVGNTGFLTTRENLVSDLQKILDLASGDAGVMAKLGRAARQRAEKNFSLDRYADDLESCYRTILRSRELS